MSKTTVKTEPVITTAVVSITGKTEQVVSANGEVVVDAAGMAVISELMEVLAALEGEEKASKETPVDEEVSTFTNEEDPIDLPPATSSSGGIKIMPNAAAAMAAILEALRQLMILNMNNVVNNMRFTSDMSKKLGKVRKEATIREAKSHLVSGIMMAFGAGLQLAGMLGSAKLFNKGVNSKINALETQKAGALNVQKGLRGAKPGQAQAQFKQKVEAAQKRVADAQAKVDQAQAEVDQVRAGQAHPLENTQAIRNAEAKLQGAKAELDAAKTAQSRNATALRKMEETYGDQLDAMERGFFNTKVENGGRYLEGKDNARIGVDAKTDDFTKYTNAKKPNGIEKLDQGAINFAKTKPERLKNLEDAVNKQISECNTQISQLHQEITTNWQKANMVGQLLNTVVGNTGSEIGRFCYLTQKAEFEQAAATIEGSKELNRDGTQASQSSYNSAFEGIREAIKVLESQRQSVKVA